MAEERAEAPREDCRFCPTEPATHVWKHTSGKDAGRLEVPLCRACVAEFLAMRERLHEAGIPKAGRVAIEIERLPNVVPGFWADDWSDVVGPAFVFGLFGWVVL